jgi:DnaK suppressor protein
VKPAAAPAKAPAAKTPAKPAPQAATKPEKPTAAAKAKEAAPSPTPSVSKAAPVKTEPVKTAAPAKPAIKAGPSKPKALPVSTAPIHGHAPYQEGKDEEYMNAKQRDHFKLILRSWKSELMEEVDRTVHHMQDESANLPDPNDRATQEEEFSLELRTRDRERKLIKKIDQTIDRIEKDDYGFCDDCGVEIGIRRLEARPTATLCIDCKSLAEIKEKQLVG